MLVMPRVFIRLGGSGLGLGLGILGGFGDAMGGSSERLGEA